MFGHKHLFGVTPSVSKTCVAIPALHKPKWRLVTRSMALDSCGVGDKNSQLKRSEVVQLLQLTVRTLLLPEIQARLRERLRLKKAGSSEVGSNSSDTVSRNTSSSMFLGLQGKKIPEKPGAVEISGVDTSRREKVGPSKPLSHTEYLEPIQSNVSPPSTVGNVDGPRDYATVGSADNSRDNSLTDLRKLKVLNVHSYVHSALRQNALKSWLKDRQIEE